MTPAEAKDEEVEPDDELKVAVHAVRVRLSY